MWEGFILLRTLFECFPGIGQEAATRDSSASFLLAPHLPHVPFLYLPRAFRVAGDLPVVGITKRCTDIITVMHAFPGHRPRPSWPLPPAASRPCFPWVAFLQPRKLLPLQTRTLDAPQVNCRSQGGGSRVMAVYFTERCQKLSPSKSCF